MRARNFVTEVMGGRGNVIGQNLSKDDLIKKLKERGIQDTEKFLEKVVVDAQG